MCPRIRLHFVRTLHHLLRAGKYREQHLQILSRPVRTVNLHFCLVELLICFWPSVSMVVARCKKFEPVAQGSLDERRDVVVEGFLPVALV